MANVVLLRALQVVSLAATASSSELPEALRYLFSQVVILQVQSLVGSYELKNIESKRSYFACSWKT